LNKKKRRHADLSFYPSKPNYLHITSYYYGVISSSLPQRDSQTFKIEELFTLATFGLAPFGSGYFCPFS